MAEEQRRKDERESLLLFADMRAGSNERRVKLRNLSSGGAMVDGVTGVVVGQSVSLNLRNIGWVEGRVAWMLDDRFGVSFSEEIDPSIAAMIMKPLL